MPLHLRNVREGGDGGWKIRSFPGEPERRCSSRQNPPCARRTRRISGEPVLHPTRTPGYLLGTLDVAREKALKLKIDWEPGDEANDEVQADDADFYDAF